MGTGVNIGTRVPTLRYGYGYQAGLKYGYGYHVRLKYGYRYGCGYKYWYGYGYRYEYWYPGAGMSMAPGYGYEYWYPGTGLGMSMIGTRVRGYRYQNAHTTPTWE